MAGLFGVQHVGSYTDILTDTHVLVFDMAGYKTPFPWQSMTHCHRVANLVNPTLFWTYSEILRLHKTEKRGPVASSENDSIFLFGSLQRCSVRKSTLTGAQKLKVSLEHHWLLNFQAVNWLFQPYHFLLWFTWSFCVIHSLSQHVPSCPWAFAQICSIWEAFS